MDWTRFELPKGFELVVRHGTHAAIDTALEHFWKNKFRSVSDLKAAGLGIDAYLPPQFRAEPILHAQAVVRRALKEARPSITLTARKFLTGEGWEEYCGTGLLRNMPSCPGMSYGSMLTETAVFGKFMDAAEVQKCHPDEKSRVLECYDVALEYCKTRGLILASAAFTFRQNKSGGYILTDAMEPETTEYCDTSSMHKKQTDIRVDTAAWRRYLFWRVTGYRLEEYQREVLHVADVRVPKRDFGIVATSVDEVQWASNECFRNGPIEGIHGRTYGHAFEDGTDLDIDMIVGFGKNGCHGAHSMIVICPGPSVIPIVLASAIRSSGRTIAVLPVVTAPQGSPAEVEASRILSSYKELLVLDDMHDEPYRNVSAAVERIAHGEFRPRNASVKEVGSGSVIGINVGDIVRKVA